MKIRFHNRSCEIVYYENEYETIEYEKYNASNYCEKKQYIKDI